MVITLVGLFPGGGNQLFPLALEEVSVTLLPEQKVVGPPATIVGVAGTAFTVTTVGAEVALHPFSVTLTV